MKELWRRALDHAFSCHIEKLFGVLLSEKATPAALDRFWVGAGIAIQAMSDIEASAKERDEESRA